MKNGNKSPGGTESFFKQVQHTRVLRFLFLETGYLMRNKNARGNIQQFSLEYSENFIQNNGKCAKFTIEVLNKRENNCILTIA